ncbi:hypothetical protein IMSAG013_01129 [Clostridiales bacterium]|nr:hypothetical protein IMSAG013_01129 [Clostridiales bacterium]
MLFIAFWEDLFAFRIIICTGLPIAILLIALRIRHNLKPESKMKIDRHTGRIFMNELFLEYENGFPMRNFKRMLKIDKLLRKMFIPCAYIFLVFLCSVVLVLAVPDLSDIIHSDSRKPDTTNSIKQNTSYTTEKPSPYNEYFNESKEADTFYVVPPRTPVTDPPITSPPVTEPPETKPPQNQEKQLTVYYTKTGECYHYENPCGRGTYYPISLDKAKQRGLRPCGKCVLH